jgi:transcriptional regulator with XRE-family HTH domain
MNIDVGQRLRVFRMQKGLSQRELAKRTGLTNGLISRIEGNSISPTISTLKKLLAGLDISIADFFTQDLTSGAQVFYARKELPDVGSQGVEFRLVGANRKGRAMSMLFETYPPGADTGEDMYMHAGEEAGVVVKGEIELTVGDEVRVLSAGDAYYFESHLPHRFRNIGRTVCTIVSASTPPTF